MAKRPLRSPACTQQNEKRWQNAARGAAAMLRTNVSARVVTIAAARGPLEIHARHPKDREKSIQMRRAGPGCVSSNRFLRRVGREGQHGARWNANRVSTGRLLIGGALGGPRVKWRLRRQHAVRSFRQSTITPRCHAARAERDERC
jgi:hypothetical protein